MAALNELKVTKFKQPKAKAVKKPKVAKSDQDILMAYTNRYAKDRNYRDLYDRFSELGYEMKDAHKIASIVVEWQKKRKPATGL